MTQWLERKYILQVGYKIPKFKAKGQNLFNGRCPFCGDSSDNPRKTRFYIYYKQNRYVAYCHNCCYTSNIPNLLKQLDYPLYQKFQMESFTEVEGATPKADYVSLSTKESFDSRSLEESYHKLKTISSLKDSHEAKIYLSKRQVPLKYHDLFRWCPDFMTWSNQWKPKFNKDALKHDVGRIIIPFINSKKELFGWTGRAISDQNEVRYIIIMLDMSNPTLFGLDRIDFSKEVYVTEGPFDACFLENSLSMCGSNVNALTTLPGYDKFIVVFDNEPHKSETIKKIGYAINQGFRVVIWPSWIEQKDINEMFLAGTVHPADVVSKNTFSGLDAKIRLAQWSKT